MLKMLLSLKIKKEFGLFIQFFSGAEIKRTSITMGNGGGQGGEK